MGINPLTTILSLVHIYFDKRAVMRFLIWVQRNYSSWTNVKIFMYYFNKAYLRSEGQQCA